MNAKPAPAARIPNRAKGAADKEPITRQGRVETGIVVNFLEQKVRARAFILSHHHLQLPNTPSPTILPPFQPPRINDGCSCI